MVVQPRVVLVESLIGRGGLVQNWGEDVERLVPSR
jgi:hypothetical protein